MPYQYLLMAGYVGFMGLPAAKPKIRANRKPVGPRIDDWRVQDGPVERSARTSLHLSMVSLISWVVL